jgi:hypothetical protein
MFNRSIQGAVHQFLKQTSGLGQVFRSPRRDTARLALPRVAATTPRKWVSSNTTYPITRKPRRSSAAPGHELFARPGAREGLQLYAIKARRLHTYVTMVVNSFSLRKKRHSRLFLFCFWAFAVNFATGGRGRHKAAGGRVWSVGREQKLNPKS